MGCPQNLPYKDLNFPLIKENKSDLTVKIRLIGILKQYAHGENEIPVDSGMTVRNSLFSIGIPPEIIALVLVNEKPVDKEHVLADGDIVQLIAVIGGGS